MKKSNTKRLVFAALCAAMCAVCTRFTAFPVPATAGYVHIGDAVLFLAASLLPTPYAMAAAVGGGVLADIMYGSVLYIIPSAVIKPLMALCFSAKHEKFISARSVFSCIAAALILTVGYYLADAVIYKSFITPLIPAVWNLIQGAATAVIFIILGAVFDAARLKSRLKI